MMRRPLPLLLLAAAAFGGCVDDDAAPGGRAPDERSPVPAELRTDWKRMGSGETFALAVADFDGDGSSEVAIGGRRTSVVRQGALEPLWIDGWVPAADDSVLWNGENDWVEALAVVSRKDAPPALLSCNSRGDVQLRDGATGALLWGKSLDLEFPYCDVLAMIGPEDAPLFVPRFGTAAIDPLTGAEAWSADLPRPPSFVMAARIPGEPTGLVAVSEGVNDDVKPASDASAFMSKVVPPWVHSIAADGSSRWSVALAQTDYIAAVAAGDLQGGAADAPILAMWDGRIVALDDGGQVRWEKAFPLFGKDPSRSYHQALFARDVTGDGRAELFAVIVDARSSHAGNGPGLVLGLSPDGEELWRQPFTGPVEHASLATLGGEEVLLLGAGPRDRSFPARALALRLAPEAETRLALAVDLPHAVYSMAVVPDADRIAIGTNDGQLRVVEATGAPAWSSYTATWIQAMTVVPGSGSGDGVAFGDEYANLAFVDDAGSLVWARPMGVKTTGLVTAITAGDLGDRRGVSIAAGAFVADPGGQGLVEVHPTAGESRRSVRFPGIPHALSIAKDAEGHPMLVAVQGPGAGQTDCRLTALAGADLSPLWDVPLPSCGRARIAVGDVDGDGVDELAIRLDAPGSDSAYLVLADVEGKILDLHQESLEMSWWLQVVPGGVVSGGAAIGSRGFVAFRPHGDSRPAWRVVLEATPDASNPSGSPIAGTALEGILVPDRNGDGIDEVAVSTGASAVALLDGATGETLWLRELESPALESQEKHLGGPLALLPATGDLPPALIMAQGANDRSRSHAFALSLDGELMGAAVIDAPAFGIGVARREGGALAAVVGAGHSLYSLRIHPLAP